MTKQYDIISLNNHLYMIDKETSIIDKWTTDGVKLYEPSETRNKLMGDEVALKHLSGKTTAILASTDTTLGLPLLPKVEEKENINTLADRYATKRTKGIITVHSKHSLEVGFIDGYKAASSKKYTEEDMKKLWNLKGKDRPINNGTKFATMLDWSFEDALQFLTPKPPIAVEVEMKQDLDKWVKTGQYMGGEVEGYWTMKQVPKTKDNIVVIRRYIYE